ncbi:MAG: hypothetical protein ACC742_06830 [Thermoanaerobaculales bacterium]
MESRGPVGNHLNRPLQAPWALIRARKTHQLPAAGSLGASGHASLLPILIFLSLAALIALPFLLSHIHESRRPVMAEARIVTATSSDTVFRTGRRTLGAEEIVEIAVALRIERKGRDDRWLAPVGKLAIDGQLVDHLETGEWPEDDRIVRVFWFTVESRNLGGRLTEENVLERLRYRSFLAPEMGRGLRATVFPEAHNDDFLGPDADATTPPQAGTVRLYARVEVVEDENDLRPLQQVATFGADEILDPAFPVLSRRADLGEGLHPEAGEFFRVPGFEPPGSAPEDWDPITLAALGLPFTDAVDQRLIVSSWLLAAVAVSGTTSLVPESLNALGTLTASTDNILRRGRPLRWGRDVAPGDLVADGTHWIVLLGDQGDGLLDPADTVLHCWGRPPTITTLFVAMPSDVSTVELFRHGP